MKQLQWIAGLNMSIDILQEIRSPIPIFVENRWKVSCEDCPASAGMQSTAYGHKARRTLSIKKETNPRFIEHVK